MPQEKKNKITFWSGQRIGASFKISVKPFTIPEPLPTWKIYPLAWLLHIHDHNLKQRNYARDKCHIASTNTICFFISKTKPLKQNRVGPISTSNCEVETIYLLSLNNSHFSNTFVLVLKNGNIHKCTHFKIIK